MLYCFTLPRGEFTDGQIEYLGKFILERRILWIAIWIRMVFVSKWLLYLAGSRPTGAAQAVDCAPLCNGFKPSCK